MINVQYTILGGLVLGLAIGLFVLKSEYNKTVEAKALPVVAEMYEMDLPVFPNQGIGSWYDYELDGYGWWSKNHRTAASRDLPRYSTALVTNLENGKSVEVYINDFGPNKEIHPDRIIDLSSYAFKQIANLSDGLIKVNVKLKE